MSSASPVLITGYAALPGKLNASQALIESMQASLPRALAPFAEQLHFMIMPLDTERVLPSLLAALAAHAPRYCVLTGQAPGRNRVQWERLAVNLRDFSEADAAGNQPRALAVDPAGPVAYWSSLPEQETAVDALNQAGIPAGFSNHAGNHLCNQLLYQSLHYAATAGVELGCGFLHIPALPAQAQVAETALPFMPIGMTREALTIVLLNLISRAQA